MNKELITERFLSIQDVICSGLENADGKGRFREDAWNRPGGGGGKSRIFEDGAAIEKGGVNFSAVFGKPPEKMLQKLKLPDSLFYATGVSIVLHPFNPMVPIVHMNIRYFEMDNGIRWFGGGIDLTPHYIDIADASFFHRTLKSTCDRYDDTYYPRFKKWADDYFYLKHRQETRGVGGIFFDHLKADSEPEWEQLFEFICAVGQTFLPGYLPILSKNRDMPFEERHKKWQSLRRGRYVEFNLVWDKGTRFGLDTSGRTESILMSMPPLAAWNYDHQPADHSEERRTLDLLKKDIDWLKMKQNA